MLTDGCEYTGWCIDVGGKTTAHIGHKPIVNFLRLLPNIEAAHGFNCRCRQCLIIHSQFFCFFHDRMVPRYVTYRTRA